MKKLFLSLLAFTPVFFCFSASSAIASQIEASFEAEESATSSEYAQAPDTIAEPLPDPEVLLEPVVEPDPLPQPPASPDPDPAPELTEPSVEPTTSPEPEAPSLEPATTSSPEPEAAPSDGLDDEAYVLPSIQTAADIASGVATTPSAAPIESGVLPSITAVSERAAIIASSPDSVTNPDGVGSSSPPADAVTNPNGSVVAGLGPVYPEQPVAYIPPETFSEPVAQLSSPLVLEQTRVVAARLEEANSNFQIASRVQPESLSDYGAASRDPSEKDGEKLVYKIELEDISFLCGEEGETPATVAKLKGQDELVVVLWDSDFFAKAGYDPQTRCKQASARFADFAEKKELSLTYMTSGKLNGQSVICLTDSKSGDCGEGIPLHEGLLFTLKPKENPDSKLEQLASIFQAEPANKPETPLKEEDKTPASSEKTQDEKEPLKE